MHTPKHFITQLVSILVCMACYHAPDAQAQAQTLAPSPVPDDKSRFHIYLLMGQSNMAGRDTRDLDKQVDNPRILTMGADGQWLVARDPIHQKIGRTEPGVGPGITFASEMLKTAPGITIGLIPCAVGGSPIKRWVKNGDLYKAAMARAHQASQAGIIKGVLWHQGETDSANQTFAQRYESQRSGMIKALRAELNAPELPVVVGQLGDFMSLSPDKYPHVETVKDAIKKMPGLLPHTGYADSSGLDHKGDRLHFNADAQRQMGLRYARAMLELQK